MAIKVNNELRLTDLIGWCIMLLAIGGWAARTEERDKSLSARIDVQDDTQKATVELIDKIREQLTDVRVDVAKYHGVEAIR